MSYNISIEKQKPRSKIIYDYKNTDVKGLIKRITEFDFNTSVFDHPIELQTELYSNVLTDAFAKFVPCKTVKIRTEDQPWANNYTRLLLRKKNRNKLGLSCAKLKLS